MTESHTESAKQTSISCDPVPPRTENVARPGRRGWQVSPGWFFILPWIVGFLVFHAMPFIASFYLSFCSYDVLSAPKWVGLANYRNLIFHDPLFIRAIWNTLFYAAFAIPLGTVASIALALLLDLNLRGMSVYRTIFFLPSIVPVVASSILWVWILNPQIGLVNAVLGYIGIPGPAWLGSAQWSKPALILMSIWGVGGSMIIYLAGLKDIPQHLYEAALVDGANAFHRVRHITLPLLTPVIFFNLVMGLIGTFQYFTQAYIMTAGGPEDSTLFYSLYLFRRGFGYLSMGYASAMAWILFIAVLAMTTAIFKSHTRWVHYE
jgi:multiple sugar transport system permease protein